MHVARATQDTSKENCEKIAINIRNYFAIVTISTQLL